MALMVLTAGCLGSNEVTGAAVKMSDGDARINVDMLTSASPGRGEMLLSAGHPGWSQADCATCHREQHVADFGGAQCVLCHGNNGARLRPDGHEDRGCLSGACHGPGPRHGESYGVNECRACPRRDRSS